VDLSRPLTDRHEICTQVWCGVKPENLRAKSFYPTPKRFGGETPKFAELQPTRPQSEVRDFETAQHSNKQMTDGSSTINALKHDTKLGASPHGVFLQPREKIDKL